MDKFIIIAKKYLVYLTGLIFFVLFCTTVTAVYKYKTLLKKYALIQEGIKVNKITAGPVTTVTKTVRYIDLTDKEKEKIAVKFNQEIEWLNFVIKQLKEEVTEIRSAGPVITEPVVLTDRIIHDLDTKTVTLNEIKKIRLGLTHNFVDRTEINLIYKPLKKIPVNIGGNYCFNDNNTKNKYSVSIYYDIY